jgi:glycosyltransferase involved in cell wall biosynthesis
MSKSVEISVIIPTRDRAEVLKKTLKTLDSQTCVPLEVIIVDASETVPDAWSEFQNLNIRSFRAQEKGAASQRSQGIKHAKYSFILFMDDDIYMQPDVVSKLWEGITTLQEAGAVSAMIDNQRYLSPGRVTSVMYRLMSDQKHSTYAGKLLGPAWNLLPEDSESLPEFVQCDWLNTTCTLYKKSALPSPVFQSHFTGYSFMEDVALSVVVSRKFRLYNARTARIFHDSQPGEDKNNIAKLAEMELINRHFIMRELLGRKDAKAYCKLFLFELFQLVNVVANPRSRKSVGKFLFGKIRALRKL